MYYEQHGRYDLIIPLALSYIACMPLISTLRVLPSIRSRSPARRRQFLLSDRSKTLAADLFVLIDTMSYSPQSGWRHRYDNNGNNDSNLFNSYKQLSPHNTILKTMSSRCHANRLRHLKAGRCNVEV